MQKQGPRAESQVFQHSYSLLISSTPTDYSKIDCHSSLGCVLAEFITFQIT